MNKLVSTLAAAAVAGAAVLTGATPALAATAVSNLQVAVSPNTSAATTARYAVDFVTSSAGALGAGSGTVTLTAASGTVLPTAASDYQVDGTAATTVSVAATAPNTATVTVPVAVAASSNAVVDVAGVKNPTFSSPQTETFSLATSADATPVTTTYTLAADTTVTATSASLSPTTQGATAATYTVGFTTSASGGLGAGSGQIVIGVPGSGTVFSSTLSDYTIADTVNGSPVSAQPSQVSLNLAGDTVTLTLGTSSADAIGTSTAVTVTAANAKNPATVGYYTAQVHTSADTDPAPAGPYQVTGTPPSTVSGVSVGVNPSTAGAQAIYSISFTTSASGALAPGKGTITVTGPAGTVFPTSASDYTVNGTQASSVSGGGGATVTVTVPLGATGTGNSSPVKLVASAVTNPSAASTNDTLTVSTSADPGTATSNTYAITPAPTSVANATATVSPDVAGQSATYTVGFTTSAAGALVAGQVITLAGPTGTAFPAAASSYAVDGTPAPSVGFVGSSKATVTVTVPGAIGADQAVVVRVLGVTNPSAAGSDSLTVSTSSDSLAVSTTSYPISSTSSPDTNVSNVSAQLSTTLSGAAAASYTIGFTTSSAGALTGGVLGVGGGSLTLSAPAGTAWSASASDYTINGTAPASATVSSSGSSVTLALAPGASIAKSSPVTVVANKVANPTATGDYTLAASTSADTDPVASGLYTITPAPTSVSDVTVEVNPNTAGKTGTYTVGFATSAQGALAAGSGTISLTAPAGTAWSTTASSYTVNGTAVSAVSAGSGSSGDQVSITVPVNVPASSAVSVTGTAINPAAGTNDTLTVATSSDTAPATSGPYSITANPTPEVTGVTASVSPTTATVAATYSVGFVTSSTGALTPGTDSITLAAPTGTVFSSSAADYTVNGATAQQVGGGGTDTVTITVPLGATGTGAGAAIKVVAAHTGNPPTPGSYRLNVSTSQDTNPAPSSAYTITPAPTVTGVSPASGPEAGGTDVTITGAGFQGATAVAFGSAAAKYTVVSDTQIDAVSPASPQPGTVDVTVTAGGLTSATGQADRFTYTAGGGYVPLATPQRLFDSRTGQSDATQGGGGALQPGTVTAVTVAGKAGLPSSGVAAVAVTVTAVGPAGDGNLRVYPDSAGTGQTPAPTISTVNYIPGQTVPNFDVVGVASDGRVDLATFGSATNAILDVTGYFAAGGGYTPLTPHRVLDTRSGSTGASVTPGTVYSLNLSTTVPASATAVALNIGAVQPTGSGNLRVYPDSAGTGQTPAPSASTINYVPGQTIDNFDIVALPSDRTIDYATFGSATNVTMDVVGYVTAGVATQTPQRLLDTRTSAGTANVVPGTIYSVQVAGQAGVPAGASAVLANVTVSQPTGDGNLRVYPDSAGNGKTSPPATSTLNYIPLQDEAVFTIVTLPADGKADFATFGSATNVVIDVVGSIS